ncbi:MAG TPA: aldo/keto reductase [Opitutaceae bacterium]|nr:aldo/keto reductase [Opitutaceae bacterium]
MKSFAMKSGARMPALGLGTWKSAPGEVAAAVREAIRIGYRHFDCAPIYGNEAEIGSALAEVFASGDVKREDLWITSKLWNSCHGRENVVPALRRTLADLRLDYLNLYLVHWPVSLQHSIGIGYPQTAADFRGPDEVPLSETWAGMEDAFSLGLCHNIGVCNFSVAKLKRLAGSAKITPVVDQVESHPYLPQAELVRHCSENGIVLTAFAPLGSGDRPARVREAGDPVLMEDTVIASIATSRGISPAQVLIAWAIQRSTSLIPKSTNPVRLAQNFEAASLTLSETEMAAIAGIDTHYRFLKGALWTTEGSPYTQATLWDE